MKNKVVLNCWKGGCNLSDATFNGSMTTMV